MGMYKRAVALVLIGLLCAPQALAAPRKRPVPLVPRDQRAQNEVAVQEAEPAEAQPSAETPGQEPAPAPEASPASETPAATEAEGVTEYLPEQGAEYVVTPQAVPEDLDAEITLEYEQTPLSDAAQRSIRDEIQIELFDMEPLQNALEGPETRERLRLTLEEAIRVSLEGNPEINVTYFEPLKSAADEYAARGEFDPLLQSTGLYTYSSITADQQIETFGGISAIEAYRTNVTGAMVGRLHYGTQYSLGVNFDKEETTFGSFIEEFSGNVALTLTQPLLRGFGKDYNTVRIKQAQNARQLSEAQLRLTMLNTIAEVVRAYWDLVGAIENQKVQESALQNAQRLFDINQTRLDIGIAADIDVLQAKAGVATRQSDLIAARAAVANAGDRLKFLLGLQDENNFSEAQVIPIDRPNVNGAMLDPTLYEENVQESIQLAMEKRPEMVMSEMEIANAELEEMRTRNEMLPQFDLTGSYTRGGRDHKLRETIYGIRDEQDQIYSYGFQASVPIWNRAARGANERARLNTRQSEQRLQQTRQQLMMNVYVAARNVLTNQALVESTRRERSIQEVNVIAEEKKLRLGTTTSFQVLQVQEDLTVAQTQEVRAGVAFEQSIVDLELARGTLLDTLGIEFEPPGPTEPVGYWKSLTPRWLD